ncbi:MAG: GFA family protein, partial [Amphiplicatus sp.]
MANAKKEMRTGGCRCGAVRFTARGAPLLVVNCHCSDCRKATGAAFATFVDYPRDAVTFERQAESYASSPGAERLFCMRCGSPIGFR